MTPQEAFFTVHRDLPREGPGQADDVLWALYTAATPETARICDAGCGPGADTVTLAKARPRGQIEGVEHTPHFVAAARARCAPYARVTISEGDMRALAGPYDLIWCAGALYFLGVSEGLKLWKSALAPGGRIAFSEPCFLAQPSQAAREFWADYAEISDIAGIRARVAAAGYRVLGESMVLGKSWEAYYQPLAHRIGQLRPGATGALAQALDEAEREIARWRAAPEEIAYALLVVEPQ